MKRVLYPGSFDPLTKGHMNIIKQASELFDEVVIAVMKNSAKKNTLLNLEERIKLIKEIYQETKNIKVVAGEISTIQTAQLYNCKAMVRGIRGVSDFDYEIRLSTINRKLSGGKISTICFLPPPEYQHVSSSVVRELLSLGMSISDYVEPIVETAIKKKYQIEEK